MIGFPNCKFIPVSCDLSLQSNVTHHVTHLNFTSWPDHSVPDSAMPLLRYIRYMRKLSGEFNPVIVHCSAGIGRTGTLMTIDSLLNMIDADQEVKTNHTLLSSSLLRNFLVCVKDICKRNEFLSFFFDGSEFSVRYIHTIDLDEPYNL